MVKGLIGRKIGMTQVIDKDYNVIPVTVIQVEPCVVVQKKTIENDGYESVQVGAIALNPKKVNKPIAGHFKKNQVAPLKYLKEFKADDHEKINVGDAIKADIFKAGDKVDVSGVSIGKGFEGAVKRHGFAGGKMTHGSRFHRLPGSMGACAMPSRVFKGKRQPGHYGHINVTIQNLKVVDVKSDKNLLLVEGAVPGCKNSMVYVKRAVKVKG